MSGYQNRTSMGIDNAGGETMAVVSRPRIRHVIVEYETHTATIAYSRSNMGDLRVPLQLDSEPPTTSHRAMADILRTSAAVTTNPDHLLYTG